MKNEVNTLPENVKIGINDNGREGMVSALGTVLADQHVLYVKLRNFHWNLTGPRFNSLHEFFEEQYKALEAAIDETAERIRMLGGVAPGSMAELTERATLREVAGQLITGDEAIGSLITDHEAVIRNLRGYITAAEEDFGDVGTADFLTGLIRKHEMDAWMLRSFREPVNQPYARESL
jgi:starvation-inducible DNA-binding protein